MALRSETIATPTFTSIWLSASSAKATHRRRREPVLALALLLEEDPRAKETYWVVWDATVRCPLERRPWHVMIPGNKVSLMFTWDRILGE